MCASPREPEHEAPEAAQRALEEEEEARLASASLAAGDPTGWFDRLYAAGARGQVHRLLAGVAVTAPDQQQSGAAARRWHKFWACSCSRQLVNSMVSISAWPVPAAGSAS